MQLLIRSCLYSAKIIILEVFRISLSGIYGIMEVRAKKSLGQHFLTDRSIAKSIVDSLIVDSSSGTPNDVLEIGPGMGVLTAYLLQRPEIALKAVEIDDESVEYLITHFLDMQDKLVRGDFLKIKLDNIFRSNFFIIGNFPYNISSQIFFKILENKDRVPQVVCMIQKEVAERIAEKPGTKTYGILSVLLQAWYDIEYLFTVGSGAFAPPPKVQSAVIRLRRNDRKELGVDESLFKTVVKTAFNQRRKTLRNSLKPLFPTTSEMSPSGTVPSFSTRSERSHSKSATSKAPSSGIAPSVTSSYDSIFDLRPERLSVEDFIALTNFFEK